MKVIHLLRKPLSEGTVASNTLKHGVGGLNIDGSRIGWEKAGPNPSTRRREAAARSGAQGGAMGLRAAETEGVGALRDRSSLQAFTAPRQGELIGRWPANLILQHLDGCRCEGTTKIRAITGTRAGRHESRGWGMRGTGQPTGHGDTDGKETVANWICTEGCPVLALDNQSGILKSGAMDSIATGGQYTTYGKMYERRVMNPASEGGASRFFKQVGGGSDSPSKGYNEP